MRRIKIAYVEDRRDESSLVDGSYLWPPNVSWGEFLKRNRDALPVERIVLAKRR
jgi:hypothetical protein